MQYMENEQDFQKNSYIEGSFSKMSIVKLRDERNQE